MGLPAFGTDCGEEVDALRDDSPGRRRREIGNRTRAACPHRNASETVRGARVADKKTYPKTDGCWQHSCQLSGWFRLWIGTKEQTSAGKTAAETPEVF
jgi:hypothetical protein